MAEGKRYFWLRLKDDFFSSKRIKKLRKLAGGDTYTIIYLKMQLLSIRTEGVLTYSGLESDFAEELALDLDEEPDNVRVTLNYLLSCDLAETSDNISFFFPWAVVNTGTETAGAQRVRDYRERQKALQCNNDVTPALRECNAKKELYKKQNKELKQEQNNSTFTDVKVCPTSEELGRVVDAWNSIGLQTIRGLTAGSKRRIMLSSRISEFGVDTVLEAIENVKNSSFLKGQKDFVATFDWFIKPSNFQKVLEGNYNDNRPKGKPKYGGERITEVDDDELDSALDRIRGSK